MSSPWPWVLGGGAAIGVVLYVRAQAAAVSNEDKCKRAKTIGGVWGPIWAAAAGAACEAGLDESAGGKLFDDVVKKIGDAIPWATTAAKVAEWDARNKALNGEVLVPMTEHLRYQGGTPPAPGGLFIPAMRGSVVEFKNGCRPFNGAVGWEQCAAGTTDMLDGGPELFGRLTRGPDTKAGNWQRTHVKHMGSGSRDGNAIDILTGGGYPPGHAFDGHGKEGKGLVGVTFPLPIPDGSAGWYSKGVPFVCKVVGDSGVNWNATDHRGGVTRPLCDDRGAVGPAPPVAEPHESHDVDCSGLGLIFDLAIGGCRGRRPGDPPTGPAGTGGGAGTWTTMGTVGMP